MKPLMRFVSAAVALSAVWFVSGCAAPASSRAPRAKVTMEFSVVESSTTKELTPEQLSDLRQAVANYLREQGLTDGRTYFVKVTFPSDNPNEEPQWAVVRIGSQMERTYQVLAAYPGSDDSYPYDLYPLNYPSSNFYPGYYSFSSWGYYDPFDFNYGYYRRPVPPRDRDDHRNPDQPKKPDQPGQKPTDRPRLDPNRWNSGTRPDPDQPRRDTPRRPDDQNHPPRDRAGTHDDQPRSTPRPDRNDRPPANPTPQRTYTPQPERSYAPPSPPPERSYTPPAESSGNSRSDSSRTQPNSRDQER